MSFDKFQQLRSQNINKYFFLTTPHKPQNNTGFWAELLHTEVTQLFSEFTPQDYKHHVFTSCLHIRMFTVQTEHVCTDANINYSLKPLSTRTSPVFKWYLLKDKTTWLQTPTTVSVVLYSLASKSQSCCYIQSFLTKMFTLAHITWVKFNLFVCVCSVTLVMTKSESSNESAAGMFHRCRVPQHVFNCGEFAEIK